MSRGKRPWWAGGPLAALALLAGAFAVSGAPANAQAPPGIQVSSNCNGVAQGTVTVAVGATLSCAITIRNATDAAVSIGVQPYLSYGGSGRLHLVSPTSVVRISLMEEVRTLDTRATAGPILLISCAIGTGTGCTVPRRQSAEITVALEAVAAGTVQLSLLSETLGVVLQPAIAITAGPSGSAITQAVGGALAQADQAVRAARAIAAGLPGLPALPALPGLPTLPGQTPPTALAAAKACQPQSTNVYACTFTITLPAGAPAGTTLTVVMTGNGRFPAGTPLDTSVTGCAGPEPATPITSTSYRISLQSACSAGAVITVAETVSLFAAGTLLQTVSSSRGGSASAGAELTFAAEGPVVAGKECSPAGAGNRYSCTLSVAVPTSVAGGTVVRVAMSGPATFVPGGLAVSPSAGSPCPDPIELSEVTPTGYALRIGPRGCTPFLAIGVTEQIQVTATGTLIQSVTVSGVGSAETALPVPIPPGAGAP